jgi:hypothetical protein
LDKIPKVQVSATGQLDLSDEEKKVTENLTCQFYGDFSLEGNPSTYEEAVQLYKKLPSLLGTSDERAVAKQIWLYPLYLLDKTAAKISRQISNNLVNKSVELIESLYRFKIKASDLEKNLANQIMLKQIKQQLSTFGGRISEFEADVKKELMELLPKVRSGTAEEKELAVLLKRVDKSSFNKQKLEDWLQIKTQEVEIVKNFVSTLAEGNIIKLSQSLTAARSNLNSKFVFCLAIHVIDKNDSFLDEMYRYLEDSTYNQKHEEISIDHWFDQNDIFESTRQNIMLFIKFADANKDDKNCQFVANEQYSDEFEKKKGISIIFYRNGVRTNFKIPNEPEDIRAAIMADRNVKIEWSKPQFGSESIQKYEISGQNNSNNQWNLLSTTTDATESIIIPNLEGKYQFKIKGITLFGVTPESNISNTVGKYNFSFAHNVFNTFSEPS